MKKLILATILSATLAGCGGSSGLTSVPGGTVGQGNFITTTVEVEQRYLYVLNSDGSVSAFVFPAEEEGEGHGHAHGRILAQEEEEEGPEATELDPSPFALDHVPIDIGVAAETYLVTLDAAGVLRIHAIDVETGLVEFQSQLSTNVTNVRRLIVSEHEIAVLGDQLSIYELSEEGLLSAPAFLDGTADWVDVALDHELATASTANGAVGFAWQTGTLIDPVFPVALPGATRGQVAYAGDGVFVLNSADNSVSQLSQEESGEIALVDTFALAAGLTNPTLMTSLFDGEDLLIADSDSVGLYHPGDGDLEDEGEADLDRVPVKLFDLPESEAVYAGHATGEGSTTILIEADGPEVLDEPGPGGFGPIGFGFAEGIAVITETSGF